MKLTSCGLTLTLPLLLIVLLLAVATKGHTVLQCYVCDNCEKVDKATPLEQCGGENFSTTTSTTTTASTSMSPMESTTTASSENLSTTIRRTSTPMPLRDLTPKPSTEDPITVNSTIDLATPPSALSENGTIFSFVGLPSTPDERQTIMPDERSTSAPRTTSTTPASFSTATSEAASVLPVESGSVFPSANVTFQAPPLGNLTDIFNSATFNRQRRHTEFNGITYHCYKIQKRYDNVFGTKRGCIGVKTEQSVCDELKMANNNQTKKCSPCTTTKCNGSSAMGVSIATLLVALLAVIYKV